jgi:hypothetical protein
VVARRAISRTDRDKRRFPVVIPVSSRPDRAADGSPPSQGREVYVTAASLSDGSPSATESEWTRFLVCGAGQGDLQESFHPNAYAQRGMGRCLTLLWSSSPGRYACRNAPGQSYDAMTLAPA